MCLDRGREVHCGGLKIQEESKGQGMHMPSRHRQGKGTESPLDPSEITLHLHLEA